MKKDMEQKFIYKGNWEKGEIEIVQPISVFKNEFLEIFNDKVKFPSGCDGTYVRVNYPVNKSVAILPITVDGKIILIKTFRHGTRGWGFEVPKGGVLEGEKTEDAAYRELKEETGLYANKFVFLGNYSESPAIYSSILSCYIAYDCKMEAVAQPEVTEAISDVITMDPVGFLKYHNELDFRDSLTEMMILRYLSFKN